MAANTTDGTDGKIQIISDATLFTVPGDWKIQASVTIGTSTWNSNIKNFLVQANL